MNQRNSLEYAEVTQRKAVMHHFDMEEFSRTYSQKTKVELLNELLEIKQATFTAERLDLFAQVTEEGVLIHKDGVIQDANDKALSILKITHEDLLGRIVHEFIVGGWQERITTSNRSHGGTVEAIWTRSDGTAFLCECANTGLKNNTDLQILRFRKTQSQRRPAQERLRLAEEMWNLYNNTPCGYHSVDENGLILRMNGTELNWLGYEPSEVLGHMVFNDMLTPRSQADYARLLPEFKKRGWAQEIEFELLRKDGTTFPVLIAATAVFDSDNNFVMSRSTVFEISDQKHAAKELLESEEKFRAIAEQSLMGIFIIQEHRLIYTNESMRRITGYSNQDLFDLGDGGFIALIHEEGRETAKRALARLMLEGEKLPPRDLKGLHKNGQPLWLELSASHVILRGIPSIFGMVTDVTDKKRAEEEKRQALSRAVRHQMAISHMATCEGQVTGDLNASLCEITQQAALALDAERTTVWLLGSDGNELRCKILFEKTDNNYTYPNVIFDTDEMPYYFEALSSARAVVNLHAHTKSTDSNTATTVGSIITLDAAIRLSGKTMGAFCVEHSGKRRNWMPDELSFCGEVADQVAFAITSHRRRDHEAKLRKAETKVRALNTRLKARVKERTEKLTEVQQQLLENAHRAGMADIATAVLHNVANILTSVITSGQIIEKTVQSSSIRSMKKANGLLDQMIDVSEPKGQRLLEFYHILEDLLSKEHLEINENVEQVLKKIDLIRDVITAQQSYASTDSQSEHLDVQEVLEDALNIQEHTLGRYDVQVVRHYQVVPTLFLPKIKVIHVLINLIKNAREAMSEYESKERQIDLSVGHTGNKVIIKVADNGIGISPEALNRIFSHGYSTKRGGHGFGLHSCVSAMEEMGGTIHVESEGSGLGATFVLHFPIREGQDPPIR